MGAASALGRVAGAVATSAIQRSPFMSAAAAFTGAKPFGSPALDVGGGAVSGVGLEGPQNLFAPPKPAAAQSAAPAAQATVQLGAHEQAAPVNSYEMLARKAAERHGVDWGVAQKVLKAEGGLDKWIQSNVRNKAGKREPSYGPMQFLVGGGDTGFPEGLGNRFIQATGMHPSDPKSAEKYFDFGFKEVSQRGWGQWYGAKHAGVGNWDGVGKRAPVTPDATAGAGAGATAQSFKTQATANAGTGVEATAKPFAPLTPDYLSSFFQKIAPAADTNVVEQQTTLDRVLNTALTMGTAGGSMGVAQDAMSETGPAVDLGADEVASVSAGLLQNAKQPSPRAASRKDKIRQRISYASS